MKLIIVVLCVVALAFAKDKYEDIENNFNIEELLGNDRLLTAYIKCLLNKGPCTPEVKKIKDKIPEVLETKCDKCTDKQKQIGKVLVKQVQKTHPELWDELKKLYDPQGKYQKEFQMFLTN
ncbi:PREDICTED: ejaculatory bulb-specific protein 3-like [Papilio polytes]|uniref:ejaculatory bulb-specific protein 3-like n=1 Tax=Papilio polytes TaxID=76194 RepID=UPI00067622C7|nr:PREDICTED: ejaculatory bulb-specific protein 3-like [Papilio polytes]